MPAESSFAFGPDAGLIGTLTLPDRVAARPRRIGLILFNAGVIHRIGPHRLNVKLARSASELGVPTLRFDIHGQGDSARAHGRLGYLDQVVCDLRAAMDELGSRGSVDGFAILGFCSGAPSALRTALTDPRVVSILLYDGFTYATLKSRLRRYALRIRQHGLARALRNWLHRNVSSARDGLRHPWLASKRMLDRASFGQREIPGEIRQAELVRALNNLVERGVRVTVLQSGDGFEHRNYASQFRDATRRHGLSPDVATPFLPQINHVVTSLKAQQVFCDYVIGRWLREAQATDGAVGPPLPSPHCSPSPPGSVKTPQRLEKEQAR